MNYFVAGMLNQPEPAFRFITDQVQGGITFADFRNTGWNAQATADAIIDDIQSHGYTKVRVFTISVGDHVARHLEEYYLHNGHVQLEVVAINPCPSPLVLNGAADTAVMLGAPLATFGCVLLGWISVIPMPFLSTPAGNYSLLLLACQANQIYDFTAPCAKKTTARTIGVVMSDQDQFLDNGELRYYFEGRPTVVISQCKHGDTIGNAEAYRQAVIEVLRNSKF